MSILKTKTSAMCSCSHFNASLNYIFYILNNLSSITTKHLYLCTCVLILGAMVECRAVNVGFCSCHVVKVILLFLK